MKFQDSSSLNIGAPNEISTETVHMTLHVYVNIFVRATEDSYNGRVKSKIIMSFLGALKGVASVSHILLEAALESLSHINPRESLSEHALNTDVKTLHYEFNRKIGDLEDAFRKASTITACEVHTCTYTHMGSLPCSSKSCSIFFLFCSC